VAVEGVFLCFSSFNGDGGSMMTAVNETLQIVGWHSLTHKRRNKQMSSTVKYEQGYDDVGGF